MNNNSCPLDEGRTVSVHGRPCEKELWKWYIFVPVTLVSFVFYMTATIE